MSEYIKKEDARAAIDKYIDDGSEYNCTEREWYQQGLMEADLAIIKLPSADVVEVKHGHWDFYGLIDDIYGHGASCSVCGGYSEDNGYYCSCCGAKMDDALQRKTNPEAF